MPPDPAASPSPLAAAAPTLGRRRTRLSQRPGHGGEGTDLWVVTYMDLITLLLVFMVMLAGARQVAQPQREAGEPMAETGAKPKTRLAGVGRDRAVVAPAAVAAFQGFRLDFSGADMSAAFSSDVLFDAAGQWRDDGRTIIDWLVAEMLVSRSLTGRAVQITVEIEANRMAGQSEVDWTLQGSRLQRILSELQSRGLHSGGMTGRLCATACTSGRGAGEAAPGRVLFHFSQG